MQMVQLRFNQTLNVAIKVDFCASHTLTAQLCLQIVFTAVWAHPPSVCETFVARRDKFERLSLPLGSNFLITAPPECSFTGFLRRKKHDESGDRNRERELKKRGIRGKVPSQIQGQNVKQQMTEANNKHRVQFVYISKESWWRWPHPHPQNWLGMDSSWTLMNSFLTINWGQPLHVRMHLIGTIGISFWNYESKI